MANWKSWILRSFIALFNFAYKVLKFFGWDMFPLTVDKVMEPLNPMEKEEVLRKDFLEPLKILLDCYRSYKDMNGMQRFLLIMKCRDYAKRRTGVKEEIKKNPDILKTPIDGPLVIIGLPRTGTTMLQRLLACDSRFVSPMTWEMMEPVPPGRPDNWKECQRYKKIYNMIDVVVPLLPRTEELRAAHDLGAALPEECFLLMHNYFMDYGDATYAGACKFGEYILNSSTEHVQATYGFYRKCLQCIFYNNLTEGQRLLLKCPFHLAFLDVYREAMPNAKFIFTYRNTNSTVASACSLFAMASSIFQGYPVDNKYIGQMCLNFFRRASSRGISTFKDMSRDSLVCFGYSELIEDPLAAVMKIYSQFNMDLPPEVLAKMQRHMEENEQNKHGKHNYGSISDFGLTEEDIKKAMPEFFEYFKDSTETLIK